MLIHSVSYSLLVRIARGAVASRRVWHILGIDEALDVFQIVVDGIEHQHERAVGDEVAGPAVPSGTEEMVEPAASLLLDEICFLCLDLRVVDFHGLPYRYIGYNTYQNRNGGEVPSGFTSC